MMTTLDRQRSTMRPDTRRALVLAKLTYFFYFGAMGAVVPYLALHYRSIGLSGSEIGLLGGVGPFVTLVAAPMWGALADILGKHKRVLVVAIAGLSLGMLGISLARDLRLLLPIVIFYIFFGSPVISLVDHTVLTLLGDRKAEYGRQRFWGAVSWGLMGALLGIITQRFGPSWIFVAFFILIGIALFVALRLPIAEASLGVSYRAAFKALLRQRWWAIVLLTVFVQMAGRATGFGFLMLHLSDLGASRALMGLSVGLASLSDVPTFFFADRLLRRWGPRGMLLFALGFTVVALLGYGLPRSPWVITLVQLLQGPSFSAMWVAGVHYAREAAPEGMGATTQALFGAVVWGLGSGCGNLIGGVIYDAFGAQSLFLGAAVAVSLAMLFFLVLGRNLGGGSKRPV